MSKPYLLIVEDDIDIANMLQIYFSSGITLIDLWLFDLRLFDLRLCVIFGCNRLSGKKGFGCNRLSGRKGFVDDACFISGDGGLRSSNVRGSGDDGGLFRKFSNKSLISFSKSSIASCFSSVCSADKSLGFGFSTILLSVFLDLDLALGIIYYKQIFYTAFWSVNSTIFSIFLSLSTSLYWTLPLR